MNQFPIELLTKNSHAAQKIYISGSYFQKNRSFRYYYSLESEYYIFNYIFLEFGGE